MNQSGFQEECDAFALKMDRLIITKDYSALKLYLKETKTFAESHHLPEYAQIFYSIGNGYSLLENLKDLSEKDRLEYEKQTIYYLREAMYLMEQRKDNSVLMASIYTNYANELFDRYRVIEALRFYRRAISLEPNFGMALGNYGRALSFYANLVNNENEYDALHCYAYQSFKKALEVNDSNVYEGARKAFERRIEEYQQFQSEEYLLASIVYSDYVCENTSERAYRQWCLEQHLFLNPLNDLMNLEIAFAYDPLTIANYTETERDKKAGEPSEPPRWYAMLNQIKEEYIYARFLYYKSTQEKQKVHYADKDVKLADYDGIGYSIRLEQLKSSFRILYSIFDQVAFAVNAFWELNFPERYADASHIFDEKARVPRIDSFHNDFLKRAEYNRALMALYWSHLDFTKQFEKSEFASDKELKDLRNAFEHKFVKVHVDQKGKDTPKKLKIENDDFYHISEEQLESYTFRLLQLAREWIMELVYAINIERERVAPSSPTIHLRVFDYDDGLKL